MVWPLQCSAVLPQRTPCLSFQQNLSAVTPPSAMMGKSLLLFSFDTDYLAFGRDHLNASTPRHIANGPYTSGHARGSKLMLASCAALTFALLSDPDTPSFSMALVGEAFRMRDACPASPTHTPHLPHEERTSGPAALTSSPGYSPPQLCSHAQSALSLRWEIKSPKFRETASAERRVCKVESGSLWQGHPLCRAAPS